MHSCTTAQFIAARETLNISKEQCAAYLRVSLKTIYRWESGGSSIPFVAYELLRLVARSIYAKVAHSDWDGWFISENGNLISPDVGGDLSIAKRLWAEIEGEQPAPSNCTFSGIATRYRKEVFPTKAPQTQRDNEKELEKLEAVFGAMPIDAIKPHHIRRYLDERGKTAPVRANREKALFSHVYNFARERG